MSNINKTCYSVQITKICNLNKGPSPGRGRCFAALPDCPSSSPVLSGASADAPARAHDPAIMALRFVTRAACLPLHAQNRHRYRPGPAACGWGPKGPPAPRGRATCNGSTGWPPPPRTGSKLADILKKKSFEGQTECGGRLLWRVLGFFFACLFTRSPPAECSIRRTQLVQVYVRR